MEGCVKSEISEKRVDLSRFSRLSRRPGINTMSFLEMTKLHLATRENEKPVPEDRILDGHFVKRIVW